MVLRNRILRGFGLALALVLLVLAGAVVNLIGLGKASDAILRENYRSILAAESMIEAIERQDSATLLLMLGYETEAAQQFRENENEFLQWLGRAKDNITVEGEGDVVRSIETGYSGYLSDFSTLHQLRTSDPPGAGRFYHETVLPSFKRVRNDAIRLREINQDAMLAASRRAERVARTAITSTIAIGLAAVAVGIGFSLLLTRRLVRPIRQIMGATEALAEGDYDVRVPPSDTDEFERLGAGFNAMAGKLGAYHRLNVERIVAETRKSEAVLRSIDDGIVVVDAEFTITDMNPTAGRMLGVEPERSEGKHFLEVIKNQRLFDHVRATAESRAAPAIEEGASILTTGDGDGARHYMFAVTAVVSKDGAMLGVVVVLRDVTRLKELDRLKSEFLMTASHELRTPLQSLGMSIDLLQEGASDRLTDKQRQLLAAAHEEVQRLGSLVTDLLDLSKIEAGKVQMDLAPAPVRVLVDRALTVFRAQVEKQQVTLTGEVPDGLPNVMADANKITWVLTNLIANALRYVGPGGHVRVSADRVGEWVHLSVADDGEGIPEEYQSRIFDKFVQVESEKSVGGTGLGLAICREIVRAHKGTIWAQSTPGKGSVFTFALPVAHRS
jgi:NtrC-family two-component system sensor histidine kinase KinB